MISFRLRLGYEFSALPNGLGLLWLKGSPIFLDDKVQSLVLEKLLGSTVSINQLCMDLASEASESEVSRAVMSLMQLGIVVEGGHALNPNLRNCFEGSGVNVSRLSQRLEDTKLTIVSRNSKIQKEFKIALKDFGIKLVADDSADFIIHVLDHPLETKLDEANKSFIRGETPWLLIQPWESKALIGPVFSQQDGVCWGCFEKQWMRGQTNCSPYDQAPRPRRNISSASSFNVPAQIKLVANMASIQIIKWLYSGASSPLRNSIIEIDPFRAQNTIHSIVNRPQCASCGEPGIIRRVPQPIGIEPLNIPLDGNNSYRTVKPEDTLAKFEHLVSPLTGILPYLKTSSNIENTPFHNFDSGRNMALQSNSLFWLNMHLRSGNGGKGKTEVQAKVGALCEAIERYCMVYPGETYSIKGTYRSIKDAIHPNECMGFSEKQLQNREQINADSHSFYALVPVHFNQDEVMEWSPVWSLTEEKYKYLPTCFCYAKYPAPDEMKLYSYPDSNGCAAGNIIEEAILQGFLELVERDAVAIWWNNMLQFPQVNLASAENAYIKECQAYYQQIGRTVHVLDITSDLGIPVFVAISQNMNPKQAPEVIYAFGAHLDANIALERAIIELNQLLPAAKKNTDGYATKDPVFRKWLATVRIEELPYLKPASCDAKNLQEDYPPLCMATIYDSIQYLLKVTEEAGLETLVLDLSQPDIGLPVVRVFVPGMRHMWRRTAPGRLFDVPVKMGWLERPLSEEELNPISIFI